MNNVMVIGKLVRDVELNHLQGGSITIAKFTLAVDRGLSKAKQEEAKAKGQPTCDFIRIVVFGKQAENCSKYLAKGRNVAIQGRIQTGSYTDKAGNKVYTTDVMAERVQFIDWSDRNNGANTNTPSGFNTVDDEHIPF